jgi:hypothetical protein
MNERIKEIELEAAYGTVDPNGPFTPEEFIKFTEKFAELIVRECAKIATYPQLSDEESYYGNEFAKAIKKHFGVEP